MTGKTLIIAEAGVNHNGDVNLAFRLCDAAKEAGADVVKFQTWITDKVITKTVEKADYQKKNTGILESQFDMLRRLELSFDEFKEVKAYCDKIGITFASTVDEPYSLDFLMEVGVPFLKVGSGDIGNIPFLRYIGTKKIPVILSTGMSSISDVDLSISALREGGVDDITLLHCTTSYPCPYEEVNMRAMLTLRDAFHLPIGYSDHTIGMEVPVMAVSLGATVIEKHFTLDRHMEGPDHIASMEPDDFKKMVRQIRNVENAMGDGRKQKTISEKRIKNVITKRIVASRDILEGEVFTEENICVKRSSEGEPAQNWDIINGLHATRNYKEDEGISL